MNQVSSAIQRSRKGSRPMGYVFELGRAPAFIHAQQVAEASRLGWAWADEVPVASVKATRLVYRVDEKTGTRRLVAVLAPGKAADVKALREVARAPLPLGDARLIRRGDVVGMKEIAHRLGVREKSAYKMRERIPEWPASMVEGSLVFDWNEVIDCLRESRRRWRRKGTRLPTR